MPLISVLTAVHRAGAGFLTEAIESVRTQQLPTGWELEWVVQEDGPRSDLVDAFEKHAGWVRYSANGQRLGIGPTRNHALSRASGSLIQVLDADDLLLPHAIATLVQAFDDPAIHWAVGQADDLLPDGSRKSFPPYLPLGRVAPGLVNSWAEDQGGNWPIHCAGLMMRAASLRAVGGWGGAPFDDDLIMFAALSEVTDGWAEEEITWLYRQHPAQATRDPHWREWGDTGRRIALQRMRAVRSAKLRIDEASDADTVSVSVKPPMKSAIKVDDHEPE